LDREVLNWSGPAVFPSWLSSEARYEESRFIPICFWQNLIFNGATIGGGGQFNIEPIDENERTFCGFQSSLASTVKQVSSHPQTNCGNGQNARERDEPKREVGRRITASLFPKPVIFAFLHGAFVGCLIPLIVMRDTIKKRKNDNEPKRKKE
jgi:hypothetical protein